MAKLLNDVFGLVMQRTAHDHRRLTKDLHNLLWPLRRTLATVVLEGAKLQHRKYIGSQIDPLIRTASADKLAEHAQKFMTLPITENELIRNDGVGKPVRILTMTRGAFNWFVDGVKQ